MTAEQNPIPMPDLLGDVTLATMVCGMLDANLGETELEISFAGGFRVPVTLTIGDVVEIQPAVNHALSEE